MSFWQQLTAAADMGSSIFAWSLVMFVVAALVLSNSRAQADSDEGRANRLKVAEDVEKNGTAAFLDDAILKLLGEGTRRNRPDLLSRSP